ncbi:GAF domain-containing protein [Oxalobacteraceae bacterium OM1]|nr:GAF domain-containing protein [Oxalobacteraceae bacterium OM1]
MVSAPGTRDELLSQCDREPIHIPGAVQPFGVLLTIDPDTLTIENASANCVALLGVPPDAALGQPLPSFLSPGEAELLGRYVASWQGEDAGSVQFHTCAEGAPAWEARAHRHQDVLFLECEPVPPPDNDPTRFHHRLRDAVLTLQGAASIQMLCELAVRQVQAFTGFDRVMVYRFDPDWHGVVVAEARAGHMDSYLGHHFPASDIPAQARAVFLQTWLRMIPDARYAPVPVLPSRHPRTGAPLDLGKALLRSVSPIHLEYLANMGVDASLTISLVDEGRLWGLIACHHASPRYVDSNVRMAAEVIGQLVSAQLRLKEAQQAAEYKAHIESAVAALRSRLEGDGDLVQALTAGAPNLLDIVSAHETAAAVCFGGEWTQLGRTPEVTDLERIVSWLIEHHPRDTTFCTERLPHRLPEAERFCDVASGMFAMPIGRTERDYILWFRPEIAATVTWAGPPEKAVRVEGGHASLHPRESFQAWTEVVRGTAQPWQRV